MRLPSPGNYTVPVLIPYTVDVPMARVPFANFALIAVTVFISVLAFGVDLEAVEPLVLVGWRPLGLLGHMFIHLDPLHLAGNLVFLWVFGNAVCAKVGNGIYLLAYVGLGLIAAVAHNLLDGRPAVGASGAINGVVGLFLILYPLNDISCFYFVFIRGGVFSLSSIWMILLWLAFDIWGAAAGGGNVAYMAHVGGFAGGAALGVLLLKSGWIEMDRSEKSLLQVLGR